MAGEVNETVTDRRVQAEMIRVDRALDAALARAREDQAGEQTLLDLSSGRYVIFSDQHRGARNRADDFRGNERAYNAALAYYHALSYHLVVLGDVEELWEERPSSVTSSYRHSLALEAEFHRQEHYLRIWGNHDDAWQYEDLVERHLAPIYGGPPLKVREGSIISVVDGPRELGELFLVHGHQGTLASDRWSWVSRFVVRVFWRPFQRLTGISLNTPAKDWRLRLGHDAMMYAWAEKQSKLVLIAGHTHRPVFKSQSHEAQIETELAALRAQIKGEPNDRQRRNLAALSAELEWVSAQEQQRPGRGESIAMARPCYFNTGCCSFLDGDVTGIEIAGGEIRLVRFPDDQGQPEPEVLTSASLESVFDDL